MDARKSFENSSHLWLKLVWTCDTSFCWEFFQTVHLFLNPVIWKFRSKQCTSKWSELATNLPCGLKFARQVRTNSAHFFTWGSRCCDLKFQFRILTLFTHGKKSARQEWISVRVTQLSFGGGKDSLHTQLFMLTGFVLGKVVLFQARMEILKVSMRNC